MQKRWSPVYIALSIGLGVVALVCTFSYASGTQGGRVLASQNVADYCSARNGVQTVSVPLYPERPDSPSFPLAYKLFRSPDSNAPTIIVIPGGPGDTLLDHSPAETYPYGALTTEHFNILYTDPRGLGCNEPAGADFPADAYRTEYLANDVTQIIRELKLDHYFIYGASFGTVVATYAARRTVEVGLNAPRAVILEGTLGRGFKGRFDEYISGFTHEWDRVKKLISNAISSRLATNPLPFGYSGEVWGQYVFKKMITGEQPGYGPLIQY
jgi:pimeloyl-ACP methyl ester carboxylesterase